MIDVVVVDDQSLVRAGLVALLNLEDDLQVVAQGANGEEAVLLAERLSEASEAGAGQNPLVFLLDVEMPQMDGLRALEQIHHAHPGIRVLMLTTFDRPGWLNRALDAGASGFLLKDENATVLAQAIRDVCAGQRVVNHDLAVRSLTLGANPLSQREKEVLRLANTGLNNAQIAQRLVLSEGTVRNQVAAAMGKTGGNSRMDAARRALQNGWL